MKDPPSRNEILLARVAVALLIALAVAGLLRYGVSTEELQRVWSNVVARPGGPMTFRFILQPAMAAIVALWDGIVSTARILILGIVMDVVYQLVFLGEFYPAEAALIAILLAFVPYALLRGPIGRVARRRIAANFRGMN